MKLRIGIAFCLWLLGFTTWSQPFIKEIDQFRHTDSIQTPPKNPILFIGSSSFTYWKDVQNYFPGRTILNRAFGGSSLTHLILYANEVIFRYQPKQIVIYCGENDLAGSDLVTADTVVQRFIQLFSMIRKRLPQTPLVYLSMKPSPSRRKYLPAMQEANQKIKMFLEANPYTKFLDVYAAMLTTEGNIRTDIFTADSLHMNSKGYALWQPLLEPLLRL
ncbi:MAG: GDSL-type esterase/lipase family protein [Sphingomonadales bacterium]